MGAVYATEEVVAPLIEVGEVLMFYTYSAHPASCAAADKVLEIMEREALVDRAAAMGEILRKKLRVTQAPIQFADRRVGRSKMSWRTFPETI